MPQASCMCGGFKLEYTGEPQMKAACNCMPCRKTSGTPRSFNLVVPLDTVKVLSGKPTKYTRVGDSGKDVNYHFCPTCGGLLMVQADALEGLMILKLGTIDDDEVLRSGKPGGELYCRNRIDWVPDLEEVQKMEAGVGS